jgi:CRISPR/Cas system-associated protein Cas10 (large subunit of type III CRISPR-Cas system)
MGLVDSKKKYEEESMGLNSEHDTDKMIDEYFAKERRKKTSSATRLAEVPSKDEQKKELLKIRTFGFKDGVLQHNMPCPVCLKKPAKYISSEEMHFFGPCEACEILGYKLENVKNKKTGFWS